MNLHEYQAKQLFRDYDIAVSEGIAVSSADDAEKAALSLGVSRWVVKAQVHAGGRGKAGGMEVDLMENTSPIDLPTINYHRSPPNHWSLFIY